MTNTKRCPHCGETKPVNAFRPKANNVGLMILRQSWCRVCMSKKNAEYKAARRVANKPGEFHFDDLLTEFMARHARMPRTKRLAVICAYVTAGCTESELVFGRTVETTTSPVFGHPTGVLYAD